MMFSAEMFSRVSYRLLQALTTPKINTASLEQDAPIETIPLPKAATRFRNSMVGPLREILSRWRIELTPIEQQCVYGALAMQDSISILKNGRGGSNLAFEAIGSARKLYESLVQQGIFETLSHEDRRRLLFSCIVKNLGKSLGEREGITEREIASGLMTSMVMAVHRFKDVGFFCGVETLQDSLCGGDERAIRRLPLRIRKFMNAVTPDTVKGFAKELCAAYELANSTPEAKLAA